MNRNALLALAAFATIAAGAARADEADDSQFALKFEGSRTRAEVMAEAALIPASRSIEPSGVRATGALKTSLTPATVRAQASEAVRLGRISSGEFSNVQ